MTDKDITLTKQKQSGWGGRRKGAGRKVLSGNENSRKYSFVAGGEIGRFLDGLEHRTDFIKESLRSSIAELKAKSSSACQQSDNLSGISRLGDIIDTKQLSIVKMPKFDVEVACGMPVDVNNNEQAEMENVPTLVCPHPERCYMIKAKGESMRDANIHSGDIVVVDKTIRQPDEKDIALCELNGEYTLKHFVRRDDGCWLVPENDEFSDIPIREGDDFNVWGVVMTVIHPYHY